LKNEIVIESRSSFFSNLPLLNEIPLEIKN